MNQEILEDKIDNLINVLDRSVNWGKDSDYVVAELMKLIQSYLTQKTIEAHLEELKNFHWNDFTWRDDMGDFILYSSDLHKRKGVRITELESQLKGLKEKSDD